MPDVLAYNVARRLYYVQVRISELPYDFALDVDRRKCVGVLHRGRLVFTLQDGRPTRQLDDEAQWYAVAHGRLQRVWTRDEIMAMVADPGVTRGARGKILELH